MFNSKYKTGDLKEALDILPEVSALAETTLTITEIEKADSISLMLVRKNTRKNGINELKEIVGVKPCRPIFYAYHELNYLPHWTRNAVKYLCDYVDQLCKHWAYICTQNEKAMSTPMGKSVTIIKKSTGQKYSNLISNLEEYNKVFYVPAKHDFTLPEGRIEHRITSKEVVYTAFITMKIAQSIREITKCNQEMECHKDEEVKHTV